MNDAGTLSAQVAERARDPFFQGTTQRQVIGLLSYSQQVVNGSLSDVTGQASLVLQPRTLIYQVSNYLSDAVKILAVRNDSGRDLEPMTEFAQLTQTNLRWMVATADYPRGWCYAGRDVIVIYPGVNSPQTLTVVYGQVTPALAVPADTTVVPAEDDDAVMDLTEILLLLKGRDLNAVAPAMARLTERMKALAEVER